MKSKRSPISHWPRRGFLKQSAALLGLSALPSFARAQAASGGLTPPDEVRARVRAARPLNGGRIPANLREILGTTHYDGRYRLTDKPYLVEGAHKIHELGMGVAKFWLHEDGLPGYAYGSDWGDALKGEMVDVLKHPYYREVLALPFSTVMLEAFPLVGDKKPAMRFRSVDFPQPEAPSATTKSPSPKARVSTSSKWHRKRVRRSAKSSITTPTCSSKRKRNGRRRRTKRRSN